MSDFIPINQWFNKPSISPFIISGPCSAETEEQLVNTALALKESNKVHLLRAGIWKPRTRPDSFEGRGEIALEWLIKAKKLTGLPVSTEVANAQHVDKCLKAGVDVLWIGARTTVSPFTVQEIVDALKGVDIPVMIKNPINPDLQLWIGAIERMYKSGNRKIAAIHRGFSWYDKSPYRNTPKWEIPIELKTIFPTLDIICDPSHITGDRKLLQAVIQKAMDLEMNGLMIESHLNPDQALSDAKQQITPVKLVELLNSITLRYVKNSNNTEHQKLLKLRSIIDEMDEQIIFKLRERFQIIKQIGEYKMENNITILQLDRWREILETRTDLAQKSGLDLNFIKEYLQVLHKESIRIQNETLSKSKTTFFNP